MCVYVSKVVVFHERMLALVFSGHLPEGYAFDGSQLKLSKLQFRLNLKLSTLQSQIHTPWNYPLLFCSLLHGLIMLPLQPPD